MLLATVSGCDSPPANPTVVVFAAASLKKPFTEIGAQFKTQNPGSSIEFSFAGASDLVTQLTQGATADVFASADTKDMDKAADAGLAQKFVEFVTGEAGQNILGRAGFGKP